MIWTSVEQIIMIHSKIIAKTGGLDGIREKIARLGYGLAANHAFIDGNKRIGAMMTQLLLKWNGYSLSLNPGELADMFISIADGKTSEKDLLQWIKDKTR